MRFAQLHAKHTAYLPVMQVAYDEKMEKVESPRRLRRRTKLDELVSLVGSASKLALESGIPKSHISAMQAGRRGLGDDLAGKLEQLYNMPAGWFDGLILIDEAHYVAQRDNHDFTERPPLHLVREPEPVYLRNNPEYPAIRRVALKAQAGVTGYAVDYMNDDGPPIVFRRDWYTAHNYQPEKMLALRVAGESMVPSLYAGDLIVINSAQTEPKDGIAFVVAYEGEIAVKRLVRDDGLWWLSSDNQDQRRYPRKKCSEDTQIIGEVVYRQTERI